MELDQILSNFKYLSGAFVDVPENSAEMQKQAREHIGATYKQLYQQDLPATVTFDFIRIWYGFYYGQYTLQCAISTPKGMYLSDPYLWPMGNYASIARELKIMGV